MLSDYGDLFTLRDLESVFSLYNAFSKENLKWNCKTNDKQMLKKARYI